MIALKYRVRTVQCSSAVAGCGWMHQGKKGRSSSAAVPASVNKKLAQKLCVCQPCAAAELDPICLPQCKLSAIIIMAEFINAPPGKSSSAVILTSKQETYPEGVVYGRLT